MRIIVRFFALARDQAGTSQMVLHVEDGTSVEQAAKSLQMQIPKLTPLMSRVAFAVNQTYVNSSTILKEGDELAIIPPVSGG